MSAWLTTTVGELIGASTLEGLGALARDSARAGFSTQRATQIEAWSSSFELLKETSLELLRHHSAARGWWVLLEYEIPRRQSRPDVVLLADDVIFVIELKVGARSFLRADRWQAERYALDLRDFHALSRDRPIVPVLCATLAETSGGVSRLALQPARSSQVCHVRCVGSGDLAPSILQDYAALHDGARPPLRGPEWADAPYRPHLSIIEAAEELYAAHSVRDISHAFADNLTATCDALVEAIQRAQHSHRRLLCVVTGVPGSGKTLTGLSAVHDPRLRREGRPSAVFLSGNGPLVKIVREALARDRARRAGVRRDAARREVSTFIQNVHDFIREYGLEHPERPPHEHVVVFDEAQRAWSAERMEQKRMVQRSEPDLMRDHVSMPGLVCHHRPYRRGPRDTHR